MVWWDYPKVKWVTRSWTPQYWRRTNCLSRPSYINKACAENTLNQMPNLQASFDLAKNHNQALHLIGLVSHGGIPPIPNIYSKYVIAQKAGVKKSMFMPLPTVETLTQKAVKDF